MYTCDFKTENFDFLNYVNLTEEQSRIIWEGRNHPEVRKWMTNNTPFSFKEHNDFITKLKVSQDKIFWAVLFQNEIIGSVCLNPYDNSCKEGELGKYLFYAYMGNGLGSAMTKEFLDYLLRSGFVHRIYAKTRIDNLRNQHVNLKFGFQIYSQDEKYVYMELLAKTIQNDK